MRRRALVSEAHRNIVTRTTRAGLFGGMWFVLVLALLGWNAFVVADVLSAAQRYQTAGASTFVIEADAGIDGGRCEAVAALDHVQAAGALRVAGSPIEPGATPGVELPTYDVTPAFLGVLSGDGSVSNGVFLSSQVSQAWGLTESEELAANGRTVAVEGVFPYPDDGRRAGLGYSALSTVPAAGIFDQCWIRVWPESDRVQALASASVVVGGIDQGSPIVSQLNTTLGARFDGEARYRARPSAFAPFALMLAGGAVGATSVRLRRLELAAARLAGVRIADQAVQLGLETAVWSVAGSGAALVVATAFGVATQGGLDWSTFAYDGLVAALASVCVLCGALIGVGSISSRRALAYFRER